MSSKHTFVCNKLQNPRLDKVYTLFQWYGYSHTTYRFKTRCGRQILWTPQSVTAQIVQSTTEKLYHVESSMPNCSTCPKFYTILTASNTVRHFESSKSYSQTRVEQIQVLNLLANELHTVGYIKIWATTSSVIIVGIWSWDDYFQMFLHCCCHQSAASSAFIMLSTLTNFLESRTIYKYSNLYSPSYLLLSAAKVIWM